MRAPSIRQRYGELIPSTVEYRSRPTPIIGERFHIYAAKARGQIPDCSAEIL
jgi:hypothetical protein